MKIPYDVWLKVRQGKDLDTELMFWDLCKKNTTSALFVEIKDVKC